MVGTVMITCLKASFLQNSIIWTQLHHKLLHLQLEYLWSHLKLTHAVCTTLTPPCVKLLDVSLPGLPGGDQCGSGEQAAAAGYGRAPGQGQPRQQSCRDPTQTHQSQWALATPAGPHRCQVGVHGSGRACFWIVEFEWVKKGGEVIFR